ncbi:MAG: hypothetical protein P4L71_20060 [Acetobacteraceae bacterium]|nr:hypothetical protein [Acetobacteraceae bacterium]
MDISTIRSKIRAGYGKAALKLGESCAIYRPAGTTAAIVSGNLIATQLAAFDTKPTFSFVNPTNFKNRLFYALTDATSIEVGDYLVSGGQTYFVATLDDIAPPMVVRCDRTLTIKRPQPGTPGYDYYGSNAASSEETILTGWPAAVLTGTKGEGTISKLPGDVRAPWVLLMMPAAAGVQIQFADILYDDLATPSRYVVSNVIYSALGAEITASQALI